MSADARRQPPPSNGERQALADRLDEIAAHLERLVAWRRPDSGIIRKAATALREAASFLRIPSPALGEKAALVEALTPSAATKAAYIGEFSFPVVARLGREEVTRQVAVPWDTIKQIMAAILARAAQRATQESERPE